MEIRPTREEVRQLGVPGTVLPVVAELPADLETPVSIFMKLREVGSSFLLESVERGEQLGRYSFLGTNLRREIITRGRRVVVADHESATHERTMLDAGKDPLHVIQSQVTRPVVDTGVELPPFIGGAVGYLGYDLVRFFERIPVLLEDPLQLPDTRLLLADTVVIFDHVKHRLLIVAAIVCDEQGDVPYDHALTRIERIVGRLQQTPSPRVPGAGVSHRLEAMTERSEFEGAVSVAREHIAAGDIFQVVLSQRLSRRTDVDPFEVYRALRRLNPSPYLFFLEFEQTSESPALALVGSSPEMMARLTDRQAEVYPIAGTRRRGRTRTEDVQLAEELAADPKERAEHVMLVDLGRNDLGRVCRYGTVQVPELMRVERYSHVMHLVSRVVGTLCPGLDAYDLVRATFPAGTVSGAPKVRAMELIERLERVRRGPYAGAVGYFGFNGAMDTCITIRTILMLEGMAYLQAGAGIVADSDPGREWEETMHKASALAAAIEQAEEERSSLYQCSPVHR